MTILNNIFTNDNRTCKIYDNTGVLLIEFDSTYTQSYSNSSTLPSEPLEQGRFSSDSKLANPFTIPILAVKNGQSYEIQNAINQLEALQNSTSLLAVQAYFKLYTDLNMFTFDYEVNVDKTILYAQMQFKQIRITSPQYATANYKNPLHKQQVQRGLQQGTPKDTSTLFNWKKGILGFFNSL